MIFEAIEFAVKAHAGQFRKGTKVPYIVHPLGVAKVLIECGCSKKVVAAGILHDTIEDTSLTVEDVTERFGEGIAALVKAVSEPDKSDTWENRKRHTIKYLQTAPMEVLLVSCADKLDNIRAIREDYSRVGESVWSRFNRSRESQRWYYRSLADVFVNRMRAEPCAYLSRQFQSAVKEVFGAD